MNRLLRLGFFCFAALLAAYAASVGYYLHVVAEPVLGRKTIGLALAGAVFFAAAGRWFSLKVKFKIFAVCVSLLLMELLLQAAAGLGVLPAVNIMGARASCARVYWTTEGRGNGIRNRFGWYSPPFDLKASHRIALLGDSQIEALQMPRTQNQAADLQVLLKRKSPDWAVFGLGISAICPAHSIDLLDYAWRHFQPQEAIVTVSIGTDVTEALPAFCRHPADRFLYYNLDSNGGLVLNPASKKVREQFDNGLETRGSLLINLPVILDSYCMISQLAGSLSYDLAMRRLQKEFVAHGIRLNGYNPESFSSPPSADARLAVKILIAQLRQCKNVCDSHGMKFRLVTIPCFPKAFYDSQHGRDWTTHIGDYDYSGPEREVVAWARTNGLPVVSVGEVIRQKNLDVEEIRSLYFTHGTGHLTEKGHALCAQAIYETFYGNSSF